MKNIGEICLATPDVRESKCDKHGVFTSRKFIVGIWTGCPKCEQERRDTEAAALAEKKRRDEEAAWQARIGHSGIPDRFRDRTLGNYVPSPDNPRQEKALAFAKHYAENFQEAKKTGKSALFIGKPGTGKTHLAVGIAMHVMPENSVLFSTVLRATRRVKDTWNKNGITETEAIESLVFPSLLILDEVGVQFGSDTEKLILFDVLNERYERRKPTILLSNLLIEEVRAYLGERIFDRLREDDGKCIVFDWPSHRGRQ